jgi:hypothetical protein
VHAVLKPGGLEADNLLDEAERVKPSLQTATIDDGAQPEPMASDGPSQARKPLGALLLDAGFIDQTQLDEVLSDGSQTGERVGEVVVRRGLASEDDVARLLAEQWELEYVDRASIWFDASALARLSREDAQHLQALPIRLDGDRVMVAVAEPTEQRLADLRRVIGEDAVVVVVPKTALDAGIRSELLASRGHSVPAESIDEPAPESSPEAPAEAPAPLKEVPPSEPVREAAPPVTLHEVTREAPPTAPAAAAPPLRADAHVNAPGVTDVGAQARHVADWVAGQAAATRGYEQRIALLEAQLAESRAATQETKTQLGTVLQLLDVLRPTV